jgi:hypothetical protein
LSLFAPVASAEGHPPLPAYRVGSGTIRVALLPVRCTRDMAKELCSALDQSLGVELSRDPRLDIGAVAELLHRGDDYLGTTAFSIGDISSVAASAEYGYVVLASDRGGPPQVVQVHDTEFDTDRIHSFGSGLPNKGIAFDPATRSLLLGDQGRVIVMRAEDNFVFPEDDAGDYVLPGGFAPDVRGIAARGGFAWVLLGRGTDNLVKLDLSQRPPRAVDIATVPVDSFARSITVGCRRVFIAGFDKVVAVDRDDLDAAGTIAVRDTQHLRVVKKTVFGLADDE